MPVFYRGPRAMITHDLFEVGRLDRRLYRLAELSRVHIVRSGAAADVSRGRLLSLSAGISALLTTPAVGRASTLATALAVVASILYLGACLRMRPAVRHDLVALCRGELVVLFGSTDQREFDAVCRGLRRAMEHRGGTR